MPDLIGIDEQFSHRGDFQLISVSKDDLDYLAGLISKLDDNRIAYPVLYMGSQPEVKQSLNRLAPFIPSSYLLNEDGKVITRITIDENTAGVLRKVLDQSDKIKPITILNLHKQLENGNVQVSARIEHEYLFDLPVELRAGYNVKVYIPELDKDNTVEANADRYEPLDPGYFNYPVAKTGITEFSFTIPAREDAHMVQYTISVPLPGTEDFTANGSLKVEAHGLVWLK
ncbi:MAG: hypothetical protein H7A35_15190 [Planctomycetales bacterium]|nr:MAG: hypothetical protein H7A35_15190 [Planctomycetales bacterium]